MNDAQLLRFAFGRFESSSNHRNDCLPRLWFEFRWSRYDGQVTIRFDRKHQQCIRVLLSEIFVSEFICDERGLQRLTCRESSIQFFMSRFF